MHSRHLKEEKKESRLKRFTAEDMLVTKAEWTLGTMTKTLPYKRLSIHKRRKLPESTLLGSPLGVPKIHYK